MTVPRPQSSLDPSPYRLTVPSPSAIRWVLFLVPCLLLSYLESAQSSEPKPLSFARDVYPVLKQACFECHGNEKQEADLRLDLPLPKDSDVIHSQAFAQSELLRRIKLPANDAERMPPIGQPLSKSAIATLERWVMEGAIWPQDFQAGKHWSYIAPIRPTVPQLESPWVRNPVDAFVLQKLGERNLRVSPQAAPETLVRRLFFDTIGLPPTPAEVDRFLSNPSEEAYEALVDELLGRTQFGERWARHWLDLARYADSHGFQRDDLRDVWAYRDWVIQAMNADMPFDQFTIEQVAGDLLPDASVSQRIATGFHRCVPTNVEAGSLPEETRVEQLIDRVNTTGAVWLGTTLECAQCHDHKYDPFTLRDYYQLLAYFNHTELEADLRDPKVPSSIAFLGPSMQLPDPKQEKVLEEVQQETMSLQKRYNARRKVLERDLVNWAQQLRESFQDAAIETPLTIYDFASEGNTDSFEPLDDGSILLTGEDPPNTDIYSFRVKLALENVTALKLETLTHPSLPQNGPGRGSGRPNFVLHELEAYRVQGDSREKLKFRTAQASFSQKNWDAAGAVDGQSKTGWAISPEVSKSHWLLCLLDKPLSAAEPVELHIRLDQHFGNARNIGRFRILAVTGSPDHERLPAQLEFVLKQPSGEWTNEQRESLLAYRAETDQQCQTIKQKIAQAENRGRADKTQQTLVMVERKEHRDSYIFIRGDYRQRGETVTAGTPAILHPQRASSPNRLALAQWLVDRDNPLVARVTVNRWWREIFGTGIVSTVEDFGAKGEPPSHPELLDYLACEFMDSGWSMKQVLKRIFMSATYRQTSVSSQEALQTDDLNRYLTRGPRFRMDAEMIRDNALAISGLIDLKPFGPPIRPIQPSGLWTKVGGQRYEYEVSPGSEQDRRGIYVVIKRGSPYPSFVNFDASARLACTVKRSRTNTPLQALNLLNDPVYVRASQAFAKRILREAPSSNDMDRIRYAFRTCLARYPSVSEQQVLQQALEAHRHDYRSDLSRAQSAWGQPDEFPDVALEDRAAWVAIASTLLNLHETITKE